MITQLNEIDLEFKTLHKKREGLLDQNPTSIITHIPTGLTAECDYERSWYHNSLIALGMLTQKVFEYNGIDRYDTRTESE